jgi:hypothetical protein
VQVDDVLTLFLPTMCDAYICGNCHRPSLLAAVQPQHARLERKGGRLFCVALSGDADDLLSDTHTWLNGSQLR